MPTLLTIPRELRDQILGYVILARQNEPPALDQNFEELVQNRTVLRNPKLGSWCRTVLYLKDETTANATKLLLINRQIQSETLDSIRNLDARTYELDVIILDEILPLPTWTCVPLHTTTLDKIIVTFRISGRYDPDGERLHRTSHEAPVGSYAQYGRYKGFQGGDGAGPAMSWQIYSILERFIKAGTRGQMTDEKKHNHMTIKTIDVNVETPPDVDPSVFARPSHHRYMRDKDTESSVLDPEYLVNFVNRDMSALLHGGGHEWFQYGKILYEHVDTVVVRKDGVEMHRYDVADLLGAAGGFAERHISEKTLEEYKTATWEARKQRGLKVLED